jgi:hypothetical protein
LLNNRQIFYCLKKRRRKFVKLIIYYFEAKQVAPEFTKLHDEATADLARESKATRTQLQEETKAKLEEYQKVAEATLEELKEAEKDHLKTLQKEHKHFQKALLRFQKSNLEEPQPLFVAMHNPEPLVAAALFAKTPEKFAEIVDARFPKSQK